MRTSVFLKAVAVFTLCLAIVVVCSAQSVTTLATFNGTDGTEPWSVLAQGLDGNFYGTTQFGGACSGCGTAFKITPGGTLTQLYGFCLNCASGYLATGGLVLTAGGDFYGTTSGGPGPSGSGAIYKITPQGGLTALYTFCSLANCADGASPYAGLVQATDGNFYGTTFEGGANCSTANGCGTVFKVTPKGALTTLYSFCSQANCADGNNPAANLIQGTDGNLYGTAPSGGANCSGCGTFFRITTKGALTTLYSFCSQANCVDGSGPNGSLVQASDGNFYGTTIYGGNHGKGTIFKITSKGALTTLYSFCAQTDCMDGSSPNGSLVQATDGNFYGATTSGGANCVISGGCGTLFKVTLKGTLTTLYSFCAQANCADGQVPDSGLIQATNGLFYGSAAGPTNDQDCQRFGALCGIVFSLSSGLGPFVATNPTSGKVGAKVVILGNNLRGSTTVTFNGKTAAFNIVSNSEITATVPAGATTGSVAVTTPSGTLTSNVSFRVR